MSSTVSKLLGIGIAVVVIMVNPGAISSAGGIIPIRVKRGTIYVILCACIALLGAQRFTLEAVSVNACLFALVLAIGTWKDIALRNTLLILAIFLSVDNGAGIYAETIWPIRYAIYVALVLSTLTGFKISIPRVLAASFLLSLPILISVVNMEAVDGDIYFRDIQIAVLILLIFSKDSTSRPFGLDVKLLVISLSVFLMAELANVALFFSIQEYQYLNFDSTKSLIVLPAFYFLAKREIKLSFVFLLVSLLVIFNYGTRMLTLVFLVTYLPYAVLILSSKKTGIIKFVFTMIIVVAALALIFQHMELFAGLKAITFLFPSNNEGGFLDIIRALDPVRYFEHVMFLNRSYLEIFFGNGFGSGLAAINNEMYFVSPYATAFSSQELSYDVYYNLHDTWIDAGLRFGLVSVFLVYILCAKRAFSSSSNEPYYWLALIVLLTCASFSTAGIILIYMLWQLASSFLCFRGNYNEEAVGIPAN